MADISDNGAFNSNLGNLASANFGPNAVANQGLTQAQTGLVGAQTQGAQLANAQQAISYQLRRNAILNMSGQFNPSGRSDASGTSGSLDDLVPQLAAATPVPTAPRATSAGPVGGSPSVAPTNTGPDGSMPTSGSGDTSGADDVGLSPADPASMDLYMRKRYFVNPAGTPQEQANIAQAALSGDEGLVKMATAQRDNNVITRKYLAQKDASEHYDVAASIENAPDGAAFQMLTMTAPNEAAQLKKQYPDDSAEQLDERTRDFVAHVAANLHQYTGRALDKREDGVYVDHDTGLPVTGVPVAGMSAKDYEAAWEKANTLVDVKQSNGTTAQVKQYQAAGFTNATSYISAAAAQAKALQAMPSHPAYAGTPAAQPGTPSQTAARAAAHIAANPDQYPQRGGLQPVQVSGQSVPVPGQPGAAPAQPARTASAPWTPNSPNGVLDLSDAPQSPLSGPVKRGVSQTPADAAIATEYGKDVAASAGTAAQRISGANAALQGANNAQIALKSGAATGPNSAYRQWIMGTLGNPAALRWALGNASASAVLAKALGNDALMDIQKEAQSGGSQMRLGQATMNMAINKLAASPEMMPDAIMTMTNAVMANAHYDRQKWGSDFAAYNRTPGVDRRADAYSAWYDNKYPNNTTISAATLAGANAPAVGTVRGVYKFSGGDPSNKTNWSKQ